MERPNENKRSVWSWSMYDWANSAFSTTVVAGFFPVFFKQYWSAGTDATVSTLRLGTANSLAGLVVVVLAPFLGAIADKGSAKKRMLFAFAALGILMTGSLFFVEQGHWQLAVLVFVGASIGFTSSTVFYDSLLVSVASDRRSDYVSSFGFALGYLGGGLLFAVNVLMTLKPGMFGLADAAHAVRVSFLSVAVWWAVFSIPIFLFVKEPPAGRFSGWTAVVQGFHQLNRTFTELRKLRTVFLFLFSYWLYIDAVQTIARMAVDYGLSLGFDSGNLMVALLITQFVGFPAAIAFGKLGERFGAKRAIYLGLVVYTAVCVFGFFMTTVTELYILAITIGLVQGGIQSLSRSLYSRIIPKNKAGEFFGFYNMLGKFAAVVGPVLMGWVGVWTHNSRFSILSLVVLFAAGAICLIGVSETKGRAAAAELEAL
jgi:UMF1 family MFS transporter